MTQILTYFRWTSKKNIVIFFEMFITAGLFPNITLPSRVTNRTATLIDQLFSKFENKDSNCYAGLISSTLSDHYPIFLFKSLELDFIKQEKKIKINTVSPFQLANLNSDLMQVNWDTNLVSSNLNDNYNIFYDKLKELYEKNLPEKFVKNDRHKIARSPWITNGLIKSIKYKDKLYIKLKKTKTMNALFNFRVNQLKQYKKILKKCINLAKSEYHRNEFKKHKNDLKNTWKLIKNIISKKNRATGLPEKMKNKSGKIFSSKYEIAQELNKIFSGSDDQIPSHDYKNCNFKTYLTNSVNSRFKFQQIDVDDLQLTGDELKTKHSSGDDGISAFVLKKIFPNIKKPLLKLINLSLETGIFPKKLKIAKIIPIYKNKGNIDEMCNYRPISLKSLKNLFTNKFIIIF